MSRKTEESRLLKLMYNHRCPADLVYIIITAEKNGYNRIAYQARRTLGEKE